MDAQKEIDRLLREHGAVLQRTRKHRVWKFPDGNTWVEASTPSDVRSAKNNLSDLRKTLGIKRETHKNPNRSHKKGAPGKPLYVAATHADAKKQPLAGFWFPSLKYQYQECRPMDVRAVPMTPLWCILRNLFGYGGISCDQKSDFVCGL